MATCRCGSGDRRLGRRPATGTSRSVVADGGSRYTMIAGVRVQPRTGGPPCMNDARNQDPEHDQDTAVAEPVVTTQSAPRTKTETEGSTRTQRQPPYNVVVLN